MALAPILFVEDERTDVLLTKLAFDRLGINHPFQVVTDGEQAIEYLAGGGAFADRAQYPFPCLVILDLNLPIKSGLEVLEWIRSELHSERLPVVVYTSSSHDGDLEKARQLGVDDYLVKSGRISETDKTVQSIKDRWLGQCVSDSA